MSALSALFGEKASDKVQSSVAGLFSKSNEVDVLKVKSKSRTVLPEIERTTKRELEETEEDTKEGENADVENTQEEGVATATKVVERKKKKPRKSEEADDLESKYYAKLMDEEEPEKEKEVSAVSDLEESSKDSDKSTIPSAKVVDLKEEELVKAEKTIFIGNVPSVVITSKQAYKEFKKLVSEDPRSKEDDVVSDEKSDTGSDLFKVDSIRFRSIAFEEALPRKVAFVHQKLHKSRDSVNAYVVYCNKNAVNIMCKDLNASVFHDHHLRVDSVTHPAPHDRKRSVFVGNLDFEEIEESLWRHFSSCGDIEYVRIVRDSKTNVGKGFAYVQFQDFQSVSKALLMNEKKMGEGKKTRKLRVTRCKNMKKVQNSNAIATKRSTKKLNEQQKTKMGRAQKVLGRADKAALGKELTIEGLRASKGENTPILNKKKNRSKTGRVTKRSQAYKKQHSK